MRSIFITIAVLLTLGVLGFMVYEIIEGRYLNAVALFGVASVFLWFATNRHEPTDVERDE
jgi:hypothetical protein